MNRKSEKTNKRKINRIFMKKYMRKLFSTTKITEETSNLKFSLLYFYKILRFCLLMKVSCSEYSINENQAISKSELYESVSKQIEDKISLILQENKFKKTSFDLINERNEFEGERKRTRFDSMDNNLQSSIYKTEETPNLINFDDFFYTTCEKSGNNECQPVGKLEVLNNKTDEKNDNLNFSDEIGLCEANDRVVSSEYKNLLPSLTSADLNFEKITTFNDTLKYNELENFVDQKADFKNIKEEYLMLSKYNNQMEEMFKEQHKILKEEQENFFKSYKHGKSLKCIRSFKKLAIFMEQPGWIKKITTEKLSRNKYEPLIRQLFCKKLSNSEEIEMESFLMICGFKKSIHTIASAIFQYNGRNRYNFDGNSIIKHYFKCYNLHYPNKYKLISDVFVSYDVPEKYVEYFSNVINTGFLIIHFSHLLNVNHLGDHINLFRSEAIKMMQNSKFFHNEMRSVLEKNHLDEISDFFSPRPVLKPQENFENKNITTRTENFEVSNGQFNPENNIRCENSLEIEKGNILSNGEYFNFINGMNNIDNVQKIHGILNLFTLLTLKLNNLAFLESEYASKNKIFLRLAKMQEIIACSIFFKLIKNMLMGVDEIL